MIYPVREKCVDKLNYIADCYSTGTLTMKDTVKEISPKSVLEIGQYIRAIRKTHGMTQDDLCQISGVNRRFISEVENGKATAEIGKVLHVLKCIGCDITLRCRK